MTILNKDSFLRILNGAILDFMRKIPVYLHTKIYSELLYVLQKSGSEGAFVTKLIEFLDIIYQHPANFLDYAGLENIKGCSDVFSMRFKMPNKNIRILFSIFEGNILLLIAFYERKGKKVSTYEAYLPTAQRRLKEMTNQEVL